MCALLSENRDKAKRQCWNRTIKITLADLYFHPFGDIHWHVAFPNHLLMPPLTLQKPPHAVFLPAGQQTSSFPLLCTRFPPAGWPTWTVRRADSLGWHHTVRRLAMAVNTQTDSVKQYGVNDTMTTCSKQVAKVKLLMKTCQLNVPLG